MLIITPTVSPDADVPRRLQTCSAPCCWRTCCTMLTRRGLTSECSWTACSPRRGTEKASHLTQTCSAWNRAAWRPAAGAAAQSCSPQALCSQRSSDEPVTSTTPQGRELTRARRCAHAPELLGATLPAQLFNHACQARSDLRVQLRSLLAAGHIVRRDAVEQLVRRMACLITVLHAQAQE